jgi:hypothetical protein
LQVIGRVAVAVQREQKKHTEILESIARIQKDQTALLQDIARSLHIRSNGRGGGNGKRRV